VRRPRGLALIMVLLVSFVMLGVILTGLQVASTNVLFVAGIHQRNQALSAAEAGVYRVMIKLEGDRNYTGPLKGKPGVEAGQEAEAVGVPEEFEAWAEHVDPNTIIIRSRGKSGRFTRSLQCTVAVGGETYEAISSEGVIATEGPNYVNGIMKMTDPLPDKGNIHTNSQAQPAIGGDSVLAVTGRASAGGTISDVVAADRKRESAPRQNPLKIDENELLEGYFDEGQIPADGHVTGNLKVPGGVEFHQPLVLSNNATLLIQGDAVFHAGIEGNGSVVVQGNLSARTGKTLDTAHGEGVLLYADGDVTLVHPKVHADEVSGELTAELDQVANFFAAMPGDAPFYMTERLPVGAPTGLDFFTWYKNQCQSPSEDFKLWRDGDGTDLSPGLPKNITTWLDSSLSVYDSLKIWAKSPK